VKVDGSILVDDPADAGPAAQKLEAAGYAGGFTFEGRHDPFLPLAVAAQQTERLELMPGIAIAFARNPMTLANIAYDLQLLSKGRFVLGLGTQIKPHIERRFSMPWSKPASRMREMVLAIRAIWDRWQNGTPLDFRGEFYNHSLMTPVFDPGPNPHGLPKIFCAGVGARMTEVVGEVADGFFVHPFHTQKFIMQTTIPALERGLEKVGRTLRDFEISCQMILVTGRDEEQLVAARNGAKAQISFYGSTPAYRPVLECHGYGELQGELNRMSKEGKWLEMAGLVDDDLLEKIAIVAPRDEIAAKVRERCGSWAQRVSLVSHFSEPDLLEDVVEDLSMEAAR
jgi:probable F420-dependent oxidoreductase